MAPVRVLAKARVFIVTRGVTGGVRVRDKLIRPISRIQPMVGRKGAKYFERVAEEQTTTAAAARRI